MPLPEDADAGRFLVGGAATDSALKTKTSTHKVSIGIIAS